MKNTLTLIRQKVGQGNIRKFVREELKVNYRTFMYQISRELVPYKTIKVLLEKLDIKFEDLKDYKYTPNADVHSQKFYRDRDKEQLKQLYLPKPQKLSAIFRKK